MTLRSFDPLKDQVAAAWKTEKRREGAQSLAAVIVGAIGDGKKLEGGAQGWNVKIRSVWECDVRVMTEKNRNDLPKKSST